MKILEVTTPHTATFKTLFEVLKESLVETNIEFKNEVEESEIKKNGIKIKAIDPTKTVLIHLRLLKEAFSTFECSKEKYTIGLNLGYFHKLIKSMDKDDKLTLYVENEDRDYLGIKIDNIEKNRTDLYKLKLLELKNEEIELPEIEFDVRIKINGTEFHKMCREMIYISDYVEIKCSKEKIIFTCKGDCAERTTTYRQNNEDCSNIDISYSEDVEKNTIIQGVFELKNLVLFGKCSSLCDQIQIYMKNNYPLVIKYTIAKLGQIILCLGPVSSDKEQYEEMEDNFSQEEDEIEYY